MKRKKTKLKLVHRLAQWCQSCGYNKYLFHHHPYYCTSCKSDAVLVILDEEPNIPDYIRPDEVWILPTELSQSDDADRVRLRVSVSDYETKE